MHHLIILLTFLSTSGSTGGSNDRQGDIKDALDIENLQLKDLTNKASKTQVCHQLVLWEFNIFCSALESMWSLMVKHESEFGTSPSSVI